MAGRPRYICYEGLSKVTFYPHCSLTLSSTRSLIGLRQSGVGVRTVSGLMPNSRGFADDLAIMAGSAAGMQKLMQVVSSFCNWTGMKVKMTKSVITAYDYKTREDLPTDGIRYNGEPLVCLPAHDSFRYLGVRTALAGRKGSVGPGTTNEIHLVFCSTKELTRLLANHQIPLSFIVPSMRMVAAARSRYSAALVPWTDADLEELFKVWTLDAGRTGRFKLEAAAQLPLHPVPPAPRLRGSRYTDRPSARSPSTSARYPCKATRRYAG